MPKKVLWMSRHAPHERQIAAIQALHGQDTIIDIEPRPFDDARQIANRFRTGQYTDMVIVAPLSVIEVLCRENIKMLWSECIEENSANKIEFRGARGQGFRFVQFRRIKRVALEFEDL